MQQQATPATPAPALIPLSSDELRQVSGAGVILSE